MNTDDDKGTTYELPKLTEEEEFLRLKQEKEFWPKAEYSYLIGTSIDQNYDEYSRNRQYKLSLDVSQFEELSSGEDSVKFYELDHPTWSITLFDLASDICVEDGEENIIPVFITHYDDNSKNTKKITGVNEEGNGICPITLELYCKFFKMFDFTNKKNHDLIYNIYSCKISTGYKFTSDDYNLPDIKAFINYFEKDRDTYQMAQLMQSLLLVSDFMNCKLVQDFACCRFAFYINKQIDYFCSLRNKPDELKKMLQQDTDMSWIKDNDDLIVVLTGQWLGEPNRWKSYDEYQSFKSKIGWIREEKEDPDWIKIEEEARKGTT